MVQRKDGTGPKLVKTWFQLEFINLISLVDTLVKGS